MKPNTFRSIKDSLENVAKAVYSGVNDIASKGGMVSQEFFSPNVAEAGVNKGTFSSSVRANPTSVGKPKKAAKGFTYQVNVVPALGSTEVPGEPGNYFAPQPAHHEYIINDVTPSGIKFNLQIADSDHELVTHSGNGFGATLNKYVPLAQTKNVVDIYEHWTEEDWKKPYNLHSFTGKELKDVKDTVEQRIKNGYYGGLGMKNPLDASKVLYSGYNYDQSYEDNRIKNNY